MLSCFPWLWNTGEFKSWHRRAACVCWRWKKHVLIRLKSWEVSRFIKPRGAPVSDNTSVFGLWWGTSRVTRHCTGRIAEPCSREGHRPRPGASLGALLPSSLYRTLPLPFPHLIKPVPSFWLTISFWSNATTSPSTCSPGLASSSKPLQL